MTSFWSRLGSWLRRSPEPGIAAPPEPPEPLQPPAPPSIPAQAPTEPAAPAIVATTPPVRKASAEDTRTTDEPSTRAAATTPATKPPPAPKPAPTPSRARTVRIGLDFGTTTTLVAVRIDDQEPRLVPLERSTDWMPSYYWRGEDGTERVGAVAENLPGPVHSIKLGLPADLASPRTYGMNPSKIALRIIEEALGRALTRLKRDRLLPDEAERLEVAANVGCSAAWDLTTRARLRDIAAKAGLEVNLASLIEEPVAAAFAVLLTGAYPGGRVLVVDIGGGTLDVCVLKAEPGTNRFTIFASGGRMDLGGDRYTDLIADRMRAELAGAAGIPMAELHLSVADDTRLWQEAESLKRDLSTRPSSRTQLPDIPGAAGIMATIEREWFEKASRPLVVKSLAAVNDVYREARLVLDRGDHPEDLPGTVYLRQNPVLKLGDLYLEDDGLEHIDTVILVGGASQMPMIQREFQRIFGSRLEDPSRYGLDPVEAIVIGLARHAALESLDYGYPNWEVSAELTGSSGQSVVEFYDPYAPVMELGLTTKAVYRSEQPISRGARTCQLVLRRVAPGEGARWGGVDLPRGTTALRLELSLLGDIRLSAVGDGLAKNLYPDRPAAPWKNVEAKHPAWIVKPRGIETTYPDWDLPNSGPG